MVPLQNATATFEQTNNDPANRAAKSIDGLYDAGYGWGLYPQQTSQQAAVFQTVTPQTDGHTWQFDLHFTAWPQGHKIQKFRMSVTTAANPSVSTPAASWTELTPLDVDAYWALGAVTSTIHPDKSVQISGVNETSTTMGSAQWSMIATSSVLGATGFRLEVFPVDDDNNGSATVGYGANSSNGNIVLTEFVVQAVPEPSTLMLSVLSVLAMIAATRRRRR